MRVLESAIKKLTTMRVSDITGIKVSNNNIRPDGKFLNKLKNPNQTERQKIGRLVYLNRVLEADKGKR